MQRESDKFKVTSTVLIPVTLRSTHLNITGEEKTEFFSIFSQSPSILPGEVALVADGRLGYVLPIGLATPAAVSH